MKPFSILTTLVIHVTTLPTRGNQVSYVQYPAIFFPSLCILLALKDVP